MLDFAGAQAAAATIMTSGEGATNKDLIPVNLPMIGMKSVWRNQIIGVYDLLFPHMHVDFPLRTETDLALKLSFIKHHLSSKHKGKKSKHLVWLRDDVPTSYISREIFVGLAGFARRGSPINAIGYGLEGGP